MNDVSDWRARIRPAESAIFLDVDGTLLGFKDRPEDVVADAALRDTLETLREAAGGAVAFVSGRTIADIDRIMHPLVWPAGGVHGAELRFADNSHRRLDAGALQDIRVLAEDFVAERPGLRLEEKGGTTFAIHFRRAPEREKEVGAFLERVVTDNEFMVQHGKMVAEVKPRNCNKGAAVEALLQTTPFIGRSPLFIGDDLTDEYGFEVVNRCGGVSIKVGSEEEKSIARHRLANISNVRSFLKFICRVDEMN